jgi:hypothetical protein
MAPRYSIAHVTPYPWEAAHEVNVYVAQAATHLSRRGHRVLMLGPSRSHELIQESRSVLRAARTDPASLLEGTDTGQPRMLAVGEVLEVPTGARRRPPAVPIDVARTVEELLSAVPLDFVHVHEPFAPSTSSSALRHSRALNVGSFHATTEHAAATQVARRFVELFFGRLDARTASFAATRDLMARHFPADYRVVYPGTSAPATAPARRASGGPVQLLYVDQEERAALRLLLRALGRMRALAPWQATIVSARGESSSTPLRASVRGHVRFLTPEEAGPRPLEHADVLICASAGAGPHRVATAGL